MKLVWKSRKVKAFILTYNALHTQTLIEEKNIFDVKKDNTCIYVVLQSYQIVLN